MPVIRNQDSVPPVVVAEGVRRQTLLDAQVAGDGKVCVARWSADEACAVPLEVAPTSAVWIQVLDGAARLEGSEGTHRLTDAHVAFLPPGFRGTLTGGAALAFLQAEVPEAARFDPAFFSRPPSFRVVDWTQEPLLDSKHDARRRIYLATPKLFGSKVLKGEMIIYPPGARGSNHHHEQAEHFRYVLRGEGTLFSNEEPQVLRAGDIVYHFGFERHYAFNHGDEDFVFAEFFVPAEHVTVWVDESRICTWLPTDKNVRGGRPSREIAAHSSASLESPEDV